MDEENRTERGPAGGTAGAGSSLRAGAKDPVVEAQLAQIRTMDPEMTGLKAILESAAGKDFRKYVGMGLDFVDAYTLAAREKLQELRDRQRMETLRPPRPAGKDHLSATSTRGQGGVSIPRAELAIIRALVPDATDEEIRRYYNEDRKRFGRD